MTATVVDEWVRAGITDVVVCPGSRSTPLTLAVTADDRLRTHVQLDERSAGFMALGLGLVSGRPAPVVTTSGTAAVELHPAVVEAHHAAVPMLVCTADRPPELQRIGAPQTIDQEGLYGTTVRLAQQLGPPDPADAPRWRSWASRAVLAATARPPGPVHCNVAFREPLLGRAAALPPGRAGGEPWHRSAAEEDDADLDALVALVDSGGPGVIVAGRGCDGAPSITELADRLAWPVLADPLSGLRHGSSGMVAAFDPLLRSPSFAASVAPAVVLQFGAPPASKVVRQWLDGAGARRAVVAIGPELPAQGRDAEVVLAASPAVVAGRLAAAVSPRADNDHLGRWLEAERSAQEVLEAELGSVVSEPAVARSTVAAAPAGSRLVVSSSMPIRDVEWFGPHRADVTIVANRGANGIDGVVSTAIGAALGGSPTVALVGDLAFLHDSTALLGAAARPIDLTEVVVDNDGGGIFSFLPQAGELDHDRFEQVFGTPHGLDLVAVASAFGAEARRIDTLDDLRGAVADPAGLTVVVVASDRDANVAHHEALHEAIGLRAG